MPAHDRRGIASALLAALLFGASTPLAKWLVGQVPPLMLAALLYLGAGAGLLLGGLPRPTAHSSLQRTDLPWLVGAILCGGVLGPVLLLHGLARTAAADAALLLNLEGVFTALLAWWVFGEYLGRRIVFGMTLILAGGLTLAWQGTPRLDTLAGPLAIAGACLCWALDNNLTRHIAGGDARVLAGSKGLSAGLVNLALALALGQTLPTSTLVLAAALVGAIGYGASLALFIVALRHTGAARTGAYFALAPFFGAALSLLLFDTALAPLFWPAAALMAFGVGLHLTEHHTHLHTHALQTHSHRHAHDEHHQHSHDFPYDGREPHSHLHTHAPITHSHPHYPDLHHRHAH